MKFYSDMEANLGVWNGQKMMEFVNGVYETDDPHEIKLLTSSNYRHDKEEKLKQEKPKIEVVPETIRYEEVTNKQLKVLLDEKGIEYNPRAKKQELYELLEKAQNEDDAGEDPQNDPEEDPDDDKDAE